MHIIGYNPNVIDTVVVLDHKPSIEDFQAISSVAEIRNVTKETFWIVEFEIIDKNTTTATPHYAMTNYPKHWKHFHYYLDFKPKSTKNIYIDDRHTE